MRQNKWRFMSRRDANPSLPTDHTQTELPLGSCYVSVGGYGTVEIRAAHDGGIHGKSVRLALPCRMDGTGEGECVVQPSDTLVIHGAHGEIARIDVQQVVDHEKYAGFRLLGDNEPGEEPESSSRDGLLAFEEFLAGVSARQLKEKEDQERTSQ